MYQIYVNKEKREIKVSKLSSSFGGALTEKYRHLAERNAGSIVDYNCFYSFCTDRKTLVDYGRLIKEQWIDELKSNLEVVESIKI